MSDTTDSTTTPERPTKDAALQLMQLSMPPFDNFLAHCASLKAECEKANALTPERAALFDLYRDALLAARTEYEDAIAEVICTQFTAEETVLLITFYTGPMHKVVEKALGLGVTVSNIGTEWQTKILERCPDVWKMLIENVAEWQDKNTPEGWETVTPDSPGNDGWHKFEGKSAEEFVPPAPEEEEELVRMQQIPGPSHLTADEILAFDRRSEEKEPIITPPPSDNKDPSAA